MKPLEAILEHTELLGVTAFPDCVAAALDIINFK